MLQWMFPCEPCDVIWCRSGWATVPLSHFELYCAVRRGGIPPRLRYMTGSRPEKSMTVAAYSSPLSVTTAVELWRGSYGQRATPFTRSNTLLMLPTYNGRGGGGRFREGEKMGERESGRLSLLCFHWISTTRHTQTHTAAYLSGDTQRLESVGSTGHDLGLVHQQDSDVVLTFNLQRRSGWRRKLWKVTAEQEQPRWQAKYSLTCCSEEQWTKSSGIRLAWNQRQRNSMSACFRSCKFIVRE